LVLVADAHEWSARSLVSILTPRGYEVFEVHSGKDVPAAAVSRQPDAIVVQETLPETDVLRLVRTLRADPRIPAETPIVVAAAGPTSRPARLAALRAGVTDLWGMPMDTEELALRLEAQLRAKFAATRARDEGLLDWATGLYNWRGLVVRARDLASHASRRHTALACVVFAPDLGETASRDRVNRELDAIEALAHGLKRSARLSDAIGRVAEREIAVLAPDTDATGAVQLGTRLGRSITRPGRRRPPLRVRAGCDGVEDFHKSGLEPLDLLQRATRALRAAEATDPSRGTTWIRSFEAGESAGPPARD
jgi:PleD family two-component response regulator